jgi:hypothetical protein
MIEGLKQVLKGHSGWWQANSWALSARENEWVFRLFDNEDLNAPRASDMRRKGLL